MWLLLHSDRIGALRAMGLTMLIIVALGPVVQPWYLSWGLVVLAPVATGKVRTLIVGLVHRRRPSSGCPAADAGPDLSTPTR